MRQPGLDRERPTPPASPGEGGKKSTQRRRQLRRYEVNLQAAIENFSLPKKDHATTKTETNLLTAKTQNPSVAEGSHGPAIDGCAQRLRCVVDNSNVFTSGEIDDRVDARRIAKKVRDDNGPGFFSQCRFDRLGSDVQFLTDVGQNRASTHG